MARPPRLVVPGLSLHVIQRGNNRTTTFLTADDFARYCDILCAASKRYACSIHAYVLMSNHVHLLMTPEDQIGPSLMMQAVGRQYVRYFNARHARTGTLWEGRYRSSPVDSERYLFVCSRYIELNPVRARLADAPSQYRWSSYRSNARGAPDPVITPHALYAALGWQPEDRQAAYRALFDDALAPQVIDVIRRAAKTRGLVGDNQFREQVENRLPRSPTRPDRRGGDRRSTAYRSMRENKRL
jgi:putative transposase